MNENTSSALTPQWMNGVVEDYVKRTYFAASRRFGHLEACFPVVYQLHEWFLGIHRTRERRAVPKGYLQLPQYRVAYLLYFAQLNAIRFHGLCRHMLQRPGSSHLLTDILRRRPLRILDVGCGPGSAVWGWCYFMREFFPELLPEVQMEIHLTDRSSRILDDAAAILDSFRPHLGRMEVHRHRFDLSEGIRQKGFDLVFLSFVLTEIPQERTRWQLVTSLLSQNLRRGLLLILEPAQSPAVKRMCGIRDQLLAQRFPARVLSPCPHGGPCPLARQSLKDFCHFAALYDPDLGPSFQAIRDYVSERDRLTRDPGAEKFLNYAGLAMTNHELGPRIPVPEQKLIISEPLHRTPHGWKHLICAPEKPRAIFTQLELHRGDWI